MLPPKWRTLYAGKKRGPQIVEMVQPEQGGIPANYWIPPRYHQAISASPLLFQLISTHIALYQPSAIIHNTHAAGISPRIF
jgi:hypothetical protein